VLVPENSNVTSVKFDVVSGGLIIAKTCSMAAIETILFTQMRADFPCVMEKGGKILSIKGLLSASLRPKPI